jgi:hypothetical protein
LKKKLEENAKRGQSSLTGEENSNPNSHFVYNEIELIPGGKGI